jgi:hypothetical protein
LDLFQESGVGGYLTDLTSGIKIFKNRIVSVPIPTPAEETSIRKSFWDSYLRTVTTLRGLRGVYSRDFNLFLAADPTDASRLRLGEEAREIQQKLQLAKFRERFELHPTNVCPTSRY